MILSVVRRQLSVIRSSVIRSHPKPTREVLHVLPGDAAGAGATRCRPFERFAAQFLAIDADALADDIALDHGQVFVLAAAMEAEPQSEAV